MRSKIIGLVGAIRAGKTTASRHLTARHGYALASNSDVLKDIASGLDLSPSRENLRKVGDAIFKTLGNDIIARYRLAHYSKPIVVDGIRYPEEIAIYRQESSFVLLGLRARDDDRFQIAVALAADGGKDQLLSPQQFADLSGVRSEENVPNLLLEADFVIDNCASISDLERAIDDIVMSRSAC